MRVYHDVDQRSSEWLTLRKGRVTASMVAAILGRSPFTTREKVTRVFVRALHGLEHPALDYPAIRWGVEHEEDAIKQVESICEVAIESVGIWSLGDWAGASPDGVYTRPDGQLGLVEAKCPYSLRDAVSPVPFKKLMEQPFYYDQVQWQLYVCDATSCFFGQWTPAETLVESVEADEAWREENIPLLKAWWDEVTTTDPTPYLTDEREVVESVEAVELIVEYRAVSEQIKELEAQKKALLSQLIESIGEKDAEVDGSKITFVAGRVTTDWQKIAKKTAPADFDFSPFEKVGKGFWRVS